MNKYSRQVGAFAPAPTFSVILALFSLSCEISSQPQWAVPALPYRILVEVSPLPLGERTSDSSAAALDLEFSSTDFSSLDLPGPVDIGSLQVIRYDPLTNSPTLGPRWSYERRAGERASRFLDLSLPWDFPGTDRPGVTTQKTFPRGGYLVNAGGEGERGRLVFNHEQEGLETSYYAVYFDVVKPDSPPEVVRQGFLGDGSPRREPESDSLTGSLYNMVTVDDWNEGRPGRLIDRDGIRQRPLVYE